MRSRADARARPRAPRSLPHRPRAPRVRLRSTRPRPAQAHSYLPTLLRGIGANWLVCLAVWTATASHGVPGKAIALWFPTMAFVCSGFEHCVANMFIIPNGMLLGAPVSVGDFLLGNLLPAAMGNVIGGAAMVAGLTFVPAGRPNLARAD